VEGRAHAHDARLPGQAPAATWRRARRTVTSALLTSPAARPTGIGPRRLKGTSRRFGRIDADGAESSPVADAWVYMLRCRDGSLYTGWTTDLTRRLARHSAGKASRYTASRLPVELVAAWAMPNRRAAMREEARIKRLPRVGKLALLDSLG
jgi:putative endonuclease